MSKGGAGRNRAAEQGATVRKAEAVVPPKETVYTLPALAVSRGVGPDGDPRWRVHFLSGGEMVTVVLTADLKAALVRDLTGVTLA